MAMSVLGCRLPRVSRRTSNASRYSGSAAARSPLASSSEPRWWMERLCGGEVAVVLQQRAEVDDGGERVRMPTAEGLALHLQRLAAQRFSSGVVTLAGQHHGEVVHPFERARMPTAVRLSLFLQRLAAQRLSLVELALGLQLRGERTQGEGCVLPICALGLEPCSQKLEAQRIAVLVHALAAAVGCVLLWARAPPFLEAVHVDPLGGAAAGARLHERAVVFIPPAQPAPLLLRILHLFRSLLAFGGARACLGGLGDADGRRRAGVDEHLLARP
eukprot:scaffold17691_cov72-Phaeocystis_antarctica.AAC.2